jgi:beta-1,4-mannosyl-glycoprotein beta-1,4-N-acetylglucosaminyltransferase
MKIYDCFMYFDEDMLLEIRLNILNKYVDKFVVIESKFLHSGKEKKLNFNINNFSSFKDKIIYLVVDQPPDGIEDINDTDSIDTSNKKKLDNSLKRENTQRNKLINGIKEANDEDLIISSDLDEIPNLKNFKHNSKISIFLQEVFYYKFNLKQPDMTWYGTRICKKKDLISFQWLRNIKSKKYPLWRLDCFFSKKKYHNIDFIKNGGWHFTSIKDPKKIHFKLSNFMHHLEFEESGLSLLDMEKMVAEKKILYDHNVDKKEKKYQGRQELIKFDEKLLPEYIIENKKKYINWFD